MADVFMAPGMIISGNQALLRAAETIGSLGEQGACGD